MATNANGIEVLDCLGLKCPRPILKLQIKAPSMAPGSILEVWADCPTFEADIRKWAEQMKKVILSLKNEGGDKKIVQVQF